SDEGPRLANKPSSWTPHHSVFLYQCSLRSVSVLSTVAQPGLLSRVGGERDDHTGEEGTAERCTPAAHPGNDLFCVGEPVGRADPQRACEVGEDVDDHQHAPDAEADRV